MELNIAIVDDMKTDAVKLENFIRSYFFDNAHVLGRIDIYSSGEEMLKNFKPDLIHLVFMDIVMNEINGIDTAKQL